MLDDRLRQCVDERAARTTSEKHMYMNDDIGHNSIFMSELSHGRMQSSLPRTTRTVTPSTYLCKS